MLNTRPFAMSRHENSFGFEKPNNDIMLHKLVSIDKKR